MAEETKDNKKSSGGASWLDTLVNRYLRFYGSSDALLEKDFNLVRDMDPELATGLWQAEVKAMMDLQTLKTMFYSEDWVYICIDRLAGAVASCPLRVMKGELVDGKMVYKPEEGNPVQKLIDNPNAFQDYYAWMYHITADLGLTGNSILYYAPASRNLLPIPTERIRMNFGKDGDLRSYDLTAVGDDNYPVFKNLVAFNPRDICHVKRPNPASLMWGLSAFVPGRKAMLFNRYSTEYLNNFYIKGAQPGLVLEMDQEANEKVITRLLRSFEQAYTGRRNQRRLLILPKGLKSKEHSHSLADQQLKEYITQNRETILALLGIPKHAVGIADTGSLGSNEWKQAMRDFWAGPVKTMQQLIAGHIGKKLAPMMGEGRHLEFDTSSVEALQDDKLAKAQLADMMLKTHTLNEVRATIYELDPIEGGDATPGQQQAPALPFGFQLPQTPKPEPIPALPAAPAQEAAEVPQVDKDIVQETPEDALAVHNRSAFVELQKARPEWLRRREEMLASATDPAEVAMVKTATKLFAAQKERSLYALMATVAAKSTQSQKEKAAPKKYDHISFTPPEGVSEEAKRGLELRKEYGRGGTPIGVKRAVQLSNRDTISPETARRMYKFFIRHEKNKDSVTPSGKPGNGMIAWKLWGGDAGQAWAGKLWKQMEAADGDGQGKAVDNFRKKIDDISLSEFRRRLRKALETLEKQYTDAAVTELLSVMEMGYQSQLVLPFNMPNEDRIQALYEQGRNRRPLILEERGLNSFADISKTTTDAIVKRVAFGVTENQTLEEIARDINKYFDELTPARAMTIARTEVLTAASLGQAAAMADAAEVIPDLRKAWFSGRDERTRGNPDGLYPKSAHDHWSMNGQVKRQDQPFVDPRSGIKLDYPRDPEAGDAGAVINCRCSMIVFPAAEAASFGIKLDVEPMGRPVD